MVEEAVTNMPCALTIAERIVLHLARYSKNAADFEVPMEVSQDGIGEALRISRAHVAVEIKKLKDSGEVSERISHVRRGKSKRKVYFLTDQGEAKARVVTEYASRNNISVDPLLDIRKCRPAELMASLSEEGRRDLSFAAAFRRPFLRAALPDSSVTLVPEDEQGMAVLPADFRAGVLASCSEVERRAAHSFAADYWLKRSEYGERLHHLLQAGRTGEAEMLLASKGLALSACVDAGTYRELRATRLRRNRYLVPSLAAEIEMAIALGDAKGAEAIGRELIDADAGMGPQVAAWVGMAALASGDVAGSIAPLRVGCPGMLGARSKASLARALAATGNRSEALRILEGLELPQAHAEDVEQLLRTYAEIGSAYGALDRHEDALRYQSKALAMAGETRRPALHRSIAETYAAMGLEEKAREHRRLAAKAP
jgi:tetratricopeptide (TPR) repeat protein/DNA-binding MarR family transcriptional regulator